MNERVPVEQDRLDPIYTTNYQPFRGAAPSSVRQIVSVLLLLRCIIASGNQYKRLAKFDEKRPIQLWQIKLNLKQLGPGAA